MSDLLPHNATPQESAIDDAVSRIGDIGPGVREVWSPERCPSNLLPWLAWAFSVDQWEPDWTDDQKRATIRAAIDVQRTKGTIGAVKVGLAALNIQARVLEWHRQQTPGAEYTYKLLVDADYDAPVRSLEQIERALEIVDRTKSLRSHLDEIEITSVTRAGPMVAAVAVSGNELVVKYGGSNIVVSASSIVVA
ncbi:phage tail protein I [Roseovarius pacificus]|uniref:phage tail protein I n=1 Tax=Roseovarius pacificus TaxID=337701 RepID=UPI002A18E5F7|nr:phage tail protein I [Roseovarius pacificus]